MADSLSVEVDGQAWTEIADLSKAGPNDAVFVNAGGNITFGDGVHGRRPPTGATVQATYGGSGGVTGNVRVSLTVEWPPPDRQLLASLGGEGRIALIPVGSVIHDFGGVKRVRYFSGQLLGVDDFRDEQQYAQHKRRFHNRALHGSGVVSGLTVSLSPNTPSQIVIAPGLALDSSGREVVLGTEVCLPICDDHSPQFVVIQYTERETERVPSPHDSPSTEASRIEEGALVRVTKDWDGGDGVLIGRILSGATGWSLDSSLELSRAT